MSIIKIFQSIHAAIKLDCFLQVHKKSEIYDEYLEKCIDSGIDAIKENHFHIKIIFKNGLSFYGWNSNRYYSWLDNGLFYGKYENILLEIDDSSKLRPSIYVKYRLYKAVNNFYKNVLAENMLND